MLIIFVAALALLAGCQDAPPAEKQDALATTGARDEAPGPETEEQRPGLVRVLADYESSSVESFVCVDCGSRKVENWSSKGGDALTVEEITESALVKSTRGSGDETCRHIWGKTHFAVHGKKSWGDGVPLAGSEAVFTMAGSAAFVQAFTALAASRKLDARELFKRYARWALDSGGEADKAVAALGPESSITVDAARQLLEQQAAAADAAGEKYRGNPYPLLKLNDPVMRRDCPM